MANSNPKSIIPDALNDLPYSDIEDYLANNNIKLIYTTRYAEYKFHLLDEKWQLKTYGVIDLSWLNHSSASPAEIVAIRLALADQASRLSFRTIEMRCSAIKSITDVLLFPGEFQRKFISLNIGKQKSIQQFLRKINCTQSPYLYLAKSLFKEIIALVDELTIENDADLNSASDPTKGAYTEQEHNEINEKLRLKCLNLVSKLDLQNSARLINQLGTLIAVFLIKTVFRRPVQIVQIKWNDILPIGTPFTSHRTASIPKIQVDFSDVDTLHLRVFRGKNGHFRHQAEIRSLKLEEHLTRLILVYRGFFKKRLLRSLHEQKLELNDHEIFEVMNRLPLFPMESLFNYKFSDKNNLFSSVGAQSDSFHKSSESLQAAIFNLSETLELHSIRAENLNLSNNRFRHTVLTNGARQGLNALQLSKITNVTPRAVKPYLDLTIDARLQIDEALATNHIINQFSRLSVDELNADKSFHVVDEFENEQGLIQDTKSCTTCSAKLAIPIGCYGCRNFKPFIEADHRTNLEKAERKLKLNQANSSAVTIRKLEICILYIKATISTCDDLLLAKNGVGYERN